MKILLVGNPNVGKSTLFNALTGAHNRTGNFHGVTVGVCERRIKHSTNIVCDLPGLYSLDGLSMEEKVAGEYILAQKGDFLVVQVIDARFLSSSLKLTGSLLAKGIQPILAFTMCEKLRQKNGKIDLKKFSEKTGLKAFEIKALSPFCRKNFESQIYPFFHDNFVSKSDISKLDLSDFYAPPTRGNGRADKYLFNGVLSAIAFLALFLCIFWVVFGDKMLGVFLKNCMDNAFSTLFKRIKENTNSIFIKSFVVDCIFSALANVLSFLPQIALLYLFLDLLEESGLMSILAFNTDGLFSKLGLSGRAIFAILMGFGCTAAAITLTKNMSDKQTQKRAIAALYFIPCSAKLPVYLILLTPIFKNVFFGAVLLYILSIGISLAVSAFTKEEEDNFLMEITDVSFPNVIFLLKKLTFQIKQFIIKVLTSVFIFSIFVWIMSHFNFGGACDIQDSFLAKICFVLKYIFYPMGINDWRAAFASLSGFVAKENIAGMLAVLYPEGMSLPLPSSIAYLTFVMLIPPCVSAVTSCKNELGRRTAYGYACTQTIFAFLCSYIVYFLLSGGAGLALVILICLGIYLILLKNKHERIYNHRKNKFKRIH